MGGEHEPESSGQRWEFVILGTTAASIAVLISTVASVRILRERGYAEDARRRTEARFSGILEIASEAIISTDGDGRIQLFNQGAERIFGYPSAEIIGRPLSLLIPERFRGMHAGHMAAFRAAPESSRLMDRRGTIWGLRQDGTEFPAEAAISKLAANGRLTFNVLLHDITDRKRAEDALRASEEQLRLITDNLPVLIAYIDREWRFRFANRLYQEWYDRPLSHIVGRTVQEVLPKPYYEALRPDFEMALTGRQITGESSVPYPDGVTRQILRIYVPHVSAENRVQGVFVLSHDVSEHKQAEDALRESEQAAQERLAQLEEAHRRLEWQGGDLVRLAGDLRIARDEAEAANRAKSEFLALMSHELRTPLNAVIGFSEIIKEETFGPVGSTQYRDYADDIHASGQHLLALINDILDLSKVESGADELHEEDISVPVAIEAVVRLVKDRAHRGGVKLTTSFNATLPDLRADQRKLKQILINLLSNAIKFTESGGRVALRCWCDQDAGLSFQVTDTGIGIAPEDIATVMAPFQQVDGQLSRKYEGTGLGLPLTKALVELHGGRLELESEEGTGTSVTVRFPAVRTVRVSAGGAPPRPDDAQKEFGQGLSG